MLCSDRKRQLLSWFPFDCILLRFRGCVNGYKHETSPWVEWYWGIRQCTTNEKVHVEEAGMTAYLFKHKDYYFSWALILTGPKSLHYIIHTTVKNQWEKFSQEVIQRCCKILSRVLPQKGSQSNILKEFLCSFEISKIEAKCCFSSIVNVWEKIKKWAIKLLCS